MDDLTTSFSGNEGLSAWSPESMAAQPQVETENPLADFTRANGPEVVLPKPEPDTAAAEGFFDLNNNKPQEIPTYNAGQIETSFPESTEYKTEPIAETVEAAEVGVDPEETTKEVEDLFARAAEVAGHIDEAIKRVDDQIAAEIERHKAAEAELKEKMKSFEESKSRLAQLTPEQKVQ